ncbi:AcrR family transcriptional regulator [Kitasatospora sp. MAP12-15]|uniref:TetR/AcrR family transcriptional regulator n=1 Tax=unclassified Kitasatospora TaxID=2633591 RepID=UPI002476A5E0|nr:TetR family transcriptional regulator [Kitasatospora sp. MAP12-44]MDH6112279.1 AcrR family transcriptional regulator [Kitasatospora sp. MAP12-44]
MAWDTARTKQLLLDAAVREFAEHGPQGARVDRIAKDAGVNKERIYQYFGNKEQLFGHVIEQELARVMAVASPDPLDCPDLGEYAGRLFDAHTANPTFLRLLRWEGLLTCEGPVVCEDERRAHYAEKVQAVVRAQQAGTVTGELAPQHLLYSAFALAAWWFATPRVVAMIMADLPDDSTQSRRAALVRLVNRLADPATP